MPRIPRLYKVEAVYRNKDRSTFHYQTPKAANERAEKLREGRPQQFSEAALAAWKETAFPGSELPLDIPEVTITPSHRVTWPHPSGDATTFDLPDGAIPKKAWLYLVALTGFDPERILRIEPDEDGLTIEFRPNPPAGQRDATSVAPKTWRLVFDLDE